MTYAPGMSSEPLPTGPDPEAITRSIRETYPETDVVTMEGAAFFSLDPDRHFPNFATIVWTDAFDQASGLSRPGAFRLNVGVSRETFARLVGSTADPDYTAFDRLLPHSVYAPQHWISILNPSDLTYREVVLTLLAEAHDRLGAQRERHRRGKAQRRSPGVS
jgi:hypothetical protein